MSSVHPIRQVGTLDCAAMKCFVVVLSLLGLFASAGCGGGSTSAQAGDPGNVTVINGATNATTTLTDPKAIHPSAVAVNPPHLP